MAQWIAMALLAAFYGAYVVKMAMLGQRNVKADTLGKGTKPKGARALEIALKCVTYAGAVAQLASTLWIAWMHSLPTMPALRVGGLLMMALGTAAFVLAIVTMKSNWRAGYSEGQDTELVTTGIYRYSRNPAFLGFDLLYIGCALAFPSLINVALTAAAVVLFHFQILGEEKFLKEAFGQSYSAYKGKTRRYLGTT